jgi:hypothetical protein
MIGDSPSTEEDPSPVYGCDDVLFGHIETMEMQSSRHGDFGSFLDAGTGTHSLRWIASIIARNNSGRLDKSKSKPVFPVTMTTYTAGAKMIHNILFYAFKISWSILYVLII